MQHRYLQYNRWLRFLPYGLLFGTAAVTAVVTSQSWLMLLPLILPVVPFVASNLRYLLCLLLFTLPVSTEYHFTPALGTDFPDELLMLAMTGIAVLLMVWRPLLLRKAWPAHQVTTMLLLMLGWAAITTLFAANPLLAVKYLLAKGWYLVAFTAMPLLLLHSRRHWVVAALCIITPMAGLAVMAIFRQAAYGFSFERVNDTVTPFFRNHVNYGAMVVAILPLLTAAWYWTASKTVKWISAILFFVFLTATYFSYSRGAWLAIPVAGVLVWVVQKRRVLLLLLLSVLLVVGTGGWLLVNNRYLDYRPDYNKTIFHTDFREHLRATYKGEDMSTTERFYRWIAAVRLSADHPLLGTGPNSFYDTYKPYAVTAYKTYVSNNPEHSTVHNYFLLLLAEQGLPGLLLFTGLLFVLFIQLQRHYHLEQDRHYRLAILAVTAVLAMVVTVNFLSDLVETDKTGGMFLLCAAFVVYLKQKEKQPEP